MDKYKINVVNQGTDTKNFWCFMSKPASLITPKVYANSSAFVNIDPSSPGATASFTIPLQYKVKAGASNKAVGLQTLISAMNSQDVNLGQKWEATYGEHPVTHKVPTLSLDGNAQGTDEIDVKTSNFIKKDEQKAQWFSSLTYGVQSQNGFIGISWSPDPAQIYRIKPKVNFYIATGDFQSNQLADITNISASAAHVTEASFDKNRECTVTLTDDGSWTISAGAPSSPGLIVSNMVEAHMYLAEAHLELVKKTVNCPAAMTIDLPDLKSSKNKSKVNKLEKIDSKYVTDYTGEPDTTDIIITGTITLATAIAVGFGYMFASGTQFRVTHTSQDGLSVDFQYNGQDGEAAIRRLLHHGEKVTFSDNAQ